MARTTIYRLYLDHGPKRKTTMVHAIDLMGCIANAGTTEEALELTPEAIRRYARFLAARGEAIDPKAPFETTITEEVTQGVWLGQGVAVFGPDHDPVSKRELGRLVDRHAWIREATLDLVGNLSPGRFAKQPAKGRSARAILLHVLGSDGAYLSSSLATDRAYNELGREAEAGQVDVREALAEAGRMFEDDLRAASPAQLKAVIPRGQLIGSVNRTLRRALEHGWEHLRELERRFGVD
jgi:uncharacterized damage-inducible protein DinB/predicted RNase H-like HicB family nuclease